ncbi:MAG: PH domain-containing protein [Planctomycetota bacterium]|nr:PH domain-containing protein [Planctomycetota bacterium]
MHRHASAGGDPLTPETPETAEGRVSFGGEAEAVLASELTVSPAVAGMVDEDETIILVARPSLWMVPLWSLEAFGIIAGLVFAFAWASGFEWAPWTETQAFGMGMVTVALRLGWQFLDWLNRLYVLTDRRIIRRRGILQVDVFEARLDRIQQTSVLQLVRERACGLGTIAFATAGTGGLDAFWEVVSDPFRIHTEVSRAIDRYGRGSGGL